MKNLLVICLLSFMVLPAISQVKINTNKIDLTQEITQYDEEYLLFDANNNAYVTKVFVSINVVQVDSLSLTQTAASMEQFNEDKQEQLKNKLAKARKNLSDFNKKQRDKKNTKIKEQ